MHSDFPECFLELLPRTSNPLLGAKTNTFLAKANIADYAQIHMPHMPPACVSGL